MANKNSYFQIIMENGKTYLRLFPALAGGESINVKELQEYLTFNKISPDSTDYMIEAGNVTEQKDILLCEGTGFAINEYFKLMFTPDKMMAVCRFYPPSNGGQLTSAAEIINDLKHKGIVVEPLEKNIAAFLANRQYCFNYVFAKGIPVTEGKHASIEYFFNTNPNTKPALNEDGSVDFFNLETISKCKKGQILATLTPEDKGKNGMRVTGERVLPREVRTAKLKFANNISLSEDGLSLIANVDGHVSLVDDKVFVSDVYEVVDVDTSTGNIDYVGNILIKGNVKTGFKVKAQGDVEVKGVVEGAEIEATGNVIIARGFNGMGKGKIDAGGNVVLKFVENGTIVAGGNITSEAIMHSDVTTSGDISVSGKKGCIVGGHVKAMGNITAVTIGSEMGGDTNIDVGVDPKIKLRAQELEGEIKKAKDNIDKLAPVLASLTKKLKENGQLSMDQTRYLKQLTEEYKQATVDYKKLNEEYDAAIAEIDDMPMDSAVIVTGNVYPGTFMTINEVSKRIATLTTHSRFVSEGADIRIKAI